MPKAIIITIVAALILATSCTAFASDCDGPHMLRWKGQHRQAVTDIINAAVHSRPQTEQAKLLARLIRLEIWLSSNPQCIDSQMYGDALKSHSPEVAPAEVLIRYITSNSGVDMDPAANIDMLKAGMPRSKE